MAAQHVVEGRSLRGADEYGIDIEYIGGVSNSLRGVVRDRPDRNHLDRFSTDRLQRCREGLDSLFIWPMRCRSREQAGPFLDVNTVQSGLAFAFCPHDPFLDQ